MLGLALIISAMVTTTFGQATGIIKAEFDKEIDKGWKTTQSMFTRHTTKTLTGYTVTVDEQGIGSVSPNIDVRHWGDKGDFASFKTVKVNTCDSWLKIKLFSLIAI
jgi:hypothetical protein